MRKYDWIQFACIICIMFMLITLPVIFAIMSEVVFEFFGIPYNTLAGYIVWLIITTTYMVYKSFLWLVLLQDRFRRIGIDLSKIAEVPVEMFDESGDVLIDMIRNDEFRKENNYD